MVLPSGQTDDRDNKHSMEDRQCSGIDIIVADGVMTEDAATQRGLDAEVLVLLRWTLAASLRSASMPRPTANKCTALKKN
ncbi:hypothetical protein INR49_024814 [Caranx melampygus]|nr:hypothetical protein INR49_024814 [Caranx melampygus]